MATYSVYHDNLDDTPTANATLEECRGVIADYFEQYSDTVCFYIIDDESEEIEEIWYWCETCGVYKTEHCPCVRAEIQKDWWWL